MPVTRQQRLSLAAAMFLITAAFGVIQLFVPLYLEAAGLNRDAIGLVLGLGTGTAMVVQPLLGRISDRIDARRPLMIGAAVAAACAYLSYPYVPGASTHGIVSVGIFVLVTALGINGFLYLNAVAAVLVGRITVGSGGGVAYAGYRVWGSVGYILVVLVLGWRLSWSASGAAEMTREGLNFVFRYGPLLFLAVAGVALFVPDRPTPRPTEATPVSAQGAEETAPARIESNLRVFLLAYFLYNFALYGASQYLSLFLKSMDASPLWITGTMAAGVVCEVLVMTRIGRLTDRFGRRPALAVAFLIMPVRLLLYTLASQPLSVLLIQTLHGLNFGIMGAVAVAFVNDASTDRNRGTAQARLISMQGLATAISPVLCGMIAQRLGYGAMFAAMALVGAVAGVVFLLRVRESHPQPERFAHRGPVLLQPLARFLQAPPGRSPEA